MRLIAKTLSAVGLWIALHPAHAAYCNGSDYDEYLDGRPPVLLNDALNEDTIVGCYREYHLRASKITGGSLWSAQHLTADRVAGAEDISRIDMDFFSEPGFPTTHGSYTNSGYDRGHMMPAGDASTLSAQSETFSVANIVPQAPSLNRYDWANIEDIVRIAAVTYGDAYVVTGPDFDSMSTTIDDGNVIVPTHAWKAVYVPQADVAGAYWCDNADTHTCEVISIDQLEQAAFVDPFPALPAALRNQSEADWGDVLELP